MTQRILYLCSQCGDENLSVEATGTWDFLSQCWVFPATFEGAHCTRCKAHMKPLEKHVPAVPMFNWIDVGSEGYLMAPNALPIESTLEVIMATCAIENASIGADGRLLLEQADETDIDWNSQVTKREYDERIFVDSGGGHWRESELVYKADPPLIDHPPVMLSQPLRIDPLMQGLMGTTVFGVVDASGKPIANCGSGALGHQAAEVIVSAFSGADDMSKTIEAGFQRPWRLADDMRGENNRRVVGIVSKDGASVANFGDDMYAEARASIVIEQVNRFPQAPTDAR